MTPSHRVMDAAASRGLGQWTSSTRVNAHLRDLGELVLIPWTLLTVAGCVALSVAMYRVEELSDMWYLLVLTVGSAGTMTVLTMVKAGTPLRELRLGQLRLHHFTEGLVLERTREGILPLRWDDVVDARILTSSVPFQDSPPGHHYRLLELTLANDTAFAVECEEPGWFGSLPSRHVDRPTAVRILRFHAPLRLRCSKDTGSPS